MSDYLPAGKDDGSEKRRIARLLTDPLLGYRASYLRRQVSGVDPARYADVDAVLVSHLHPDHLDLPSLERLGRETLLVVVVVVVVPRGGGAVCSGSAGSGAWPRRRRGSAL